MNNNIMINYKLLQNCPKNMKIIDDILVKN